VATQHTRLAIIDDMSAKIPPEIRAAMAEIARKFGKQGGKKAAQNMTAEERTARAKKAAKVAAEKRTAARLARENAAAKRPSPRAKTPRK
jgi:hypothetical protein